MTVEAQGQVVQFILSCRHGRFPDLAFFDFAVAGDDVDPPVRPVQLGRHGHAVGSRQALSQGSRRHVDARRRIHVGIALEHGAALAQVPQFIFREKAPFGQRRIQSRYGMALGEDETVPVRPVRPLGIDPHDIEIQDLQHIDDGQRAAGMTGLGQGDHLDDILPHVSRMTAQFFAIHEKAPFCLPL